MKQSSKRTNAPKSDILKARAIAGGSLTPEQVARYDTEGYLVLPGFLTQEELLGVKAAMSWRVDQIAEELLRDGLVKDKIEDHPFETRLGDLFRGLDQSHFLKYGRSWRDRHAGYFDLMSNPKILDAVESLIGNEIFSNPVYNTRPKVPVVAAGAVPWHQDKSYWPEANANPVITVWIPVVDSTLENGCLHIWPGTHRARIFEYHQETYSGTGYTEINEEHMKGARFVSIPLKAGGAILFNDRCVHSSTPNNSPTQVRWSVDLRYQPTDQDPMTGHGAGFLARSQKHPEKVATLEDWLAKRLEHQAETVAA